MKKILFVALLILVGTTITTTAQDNKHGKKKDKHHEEAPVLCLPDVALTTANDTLSYATGVAVTRGLLQYLQTSCNFDTLFFADFAKGFCEAIARGSDPKYVAYNAGIQIGMQASGTILPKEGEFYEESPNSLVPEIFYKGFLDGAQGDTTYFTNIAASQYVEDVKKAITDKKNAEYDAENKAWLEENKLKEGVITLPSGLQYKVLAEGEGVVATDTNTVTVRYEGKMIDGTVFDSSYDRKPDTAKFKPTKVIKGWEEALLMMPEGAKWELYIPQELAYGSRNQAKIKPYSTLIFTVEVVKVE